MAQITRLGLSGTPRVNTREQIVYTLLADDIQSLTELGTPVLGGELTLTDADLEAIADAVYNKFVLEGFDPVKIMEMWQLMGLDAVNPVTTTQNDTNVDTIALDITGDGVTTSTISRQ